MVATNLWRTNLARDHETTDEQCLRDLRSTDPRDDKKTLQSRKDDLLKDSYAWILDDPAFINWQNNDETQVLWIKGGPGKGKTMLVIALVNELSTRLQSSSEPGYLSYFFCQGTDQRYNNAVSVLRGLIYLLVIQQTSLTKHLRKRYDTAGRRLFTDINAWSALSAIFEDIVQDPSLTRVFLMIDALDECESGLSQLLKLITHTFEPPSRVKWLVSSRIRSDIEKQLKSDGLGLRINLESNSSHISHAINAFIDFKVAKLAEDNEYDSELYEEISSYLRRNAEGTFLWVALVCKKLQEVEAWETLQILKEFPPGLEPLYARMIEQIRRLSHTNMEYCLQILSTAAIIYRPLHLKELAAIAGLPEKSFCDIRSVNKLVDLCGSFFTIREEIISFVHQSAKDYFTTGKGLKIFPSSQAEEHRRIACRSLQVMLNTLKRDICGLRMPGALLENVESSIKQDILAPIRYACCYWVDHLCQVSHLSLDEIGLCDSGKVHIFLQKHFLHWLEALSLMRNMSGAVVMVKTLESLLTVSDSIKLRSVILADLAKPQPNSTTLLFPMIQDALRFILYNRSIIEKAPLQVYASALVFSPRKSTIRRLFRNEEPSWIISSPTLEENWNVCLQTLEDHTGAVTSVTFSPDGRRLASSSDDKIVRIWYAETGALQQTLKGHTGRVYSVMFSPDGRRLASSSNDKTIRIWDAETGALQQTFKGHTSGVISVTFSPDGHRLASSSDDKTVRVWDAETGAPQQTLKGHTSRVYSVTFSSDGRRLASSSGDETVRIWDAETGALQQTLEGHTSWVYSVTFSPDGRRLASSSYDETLRIWDAETGALQQTLKGHTSSVSSVTFSPDGRRLASSSGDETVRIWDAETGALQQTLKGHTSRATSVTFTPDGRRLASSSRDGTVRIWDAETGALQQTLKGHTNWVYSVMFSPDGRRLASSSYDENVRIWNAETGALQQTLEGHTSWVYSVTFSPDGRRLASSSYDETVRIWDAETGALLQTLKGHTNAVTSVTFSPDGHRLASSSYDETVRIWDAETEALQQTLKGHTSRVCSVMFSPDGRRLASSSRDETVRIWDAETGALQQTLVGHTSWVYSLTFSPDGRRLASSSYDENVRIWDAETGALQQMLKAHTSSVFSVTFSPNGRRLASSSGDKTVRIWDVETGVLRQTLEIGSSLTEVSFSSDDLYLITELGSFALSQSSSLANRTPNWLGYCISNNRSWITWNGNNVLWLPLEYQPISSIVKKQTIVIGCTSGRVLLIKFSSDVFPT